MEIQILQTSYLLDNSVFATTIDMNVIYADGNIVLARE